MKRAAIRSRKVAKERIVQQLRRGQKPFHGAQGPAGPKDAKDLRGSKGVLLKHAEQLAVAEEANAGPTGIRRALSRSSSTTARR